MFNYLYIAVGLICWIPFSFIVPRLIDGGSWSSLDDAFFKVLSLIMGAIGALLWPLAMLVCVLFLIFKWFGRFGIGRKFDTLIDRVLDK